MIEKIVLDFINENLTNNTKAYMELPTGKNPDRFVVIQKTGTSTENFVTTATFALQSYGTSLYDSATLNEEVKGIMEKLPQIDRVASAKINSDYYYPNTTTKAYRYQSVFDVVYV